MHPAVEWRIYDTYIVRRNFYFALLDWHNSLTAKTTKKVTKLKNNILSRSGLFLVF